MKYIILDTSHKNLNIGLVDGDVIVENFQEDCNKQQSEQIIPMLHRLLEGQKWTIDDLDAMVVTKGPGSYTGVRIAMTVAKVICSLKQLPLYTISTLLAHAGMRDNVLVLMDARSQRAYVGVYDNGNIVVDDCILTLDEVKQLAEEHQYHVVGDGGLVGQADTTEDLIQLVVALRDYWTLVDNVHTLMPVYLKETAVYGK